MMKRKTTGNIFLLCIVFALAVLTPGCRVRGESFAEPDRLSTIEYYYLNVCGSCEPEKELLDNLQRTSGINFSSSGIAVLFYNIYDEYNETRWEKTLDELGYEEGQIDVPAIRIGSELLPVNQLEDDAIPDILSDDSDRALIGIYDSVVILFTSPGCAECVKVEDVLADLPAAIRSGDIDSSIRIIRYSISDSRSARMMRDYCSYFSVPSIDQETPLLLGGREYLQGYDEIRDRLPDLLVSGECIGTVVLPSGIESGINDAVEVVAWYTVLGIGLVNGVNPCAASMLLLFLSLLLANRKWLLHIGFAFAIGKLAGFLLLGTLLYRILDSIDYSVFGLAAKILFLALAVTMIALNLNDYFAAKKERYGHIVLQLPRSLRKMNHRLIRALSSAHTKGWIVAGSLTLGFLLSFGEFLCTGQLYLATILGMVHTSGLRQDAALGYLLLYSTAFVIPVAAVSILIYKGQGILNLTEFFRRHEALIKLINAGVYLVFGILMLLLY